MLPMKYYGMAFVFVIAVFRLVNTICIIIMHVIMYNK